MKIGKYSFKNGSHHEDDMTISNGFVFAQYKKQFLCEEENPPNRMGNKITSDCFNLTRILKSEFCFLYYIFE